MKNISKLILSLIFISISGCIFAPVNIRTRIVIEREICEEIKYQITPKQVKKNIDLANKIYAFAGVHFVVEAVEIKRNPYLASFCWADADKHPDFLSIYYVYPDEYKDKYRGMSMFVFSNGIVITPLADTSTTAHELGHWGGLMHTFEDFLSDTPVQINSDCKKDGDPNCHNIMNYCDHGRYIITWEQINSFRKTVLALKKNLMTTSTNDILGRYDENWEASDGW